MWNGYNEGENSLPIYAIGLMANHLSSQLGARSTFGYGVRLFSHLPLPSELPNFGTPAIRLFANLMAAYPWSFCHQNNPPQNKTLMSNISGSPVFTGFVDSSRTFKTSAFNHSAISPRDKTSISNYIRVSRRSQRPKWGFGGSDGAFSGGFGGLRLILDENSRLVSLIRIRGMGEIGWKKQRQLA
jgi:hypothetical protein